VAHQAVILAAGIGSRLAPLTNDRPKCLVEIRGEAILDRLLRQLASAGIHRAVIVTGHLSRKLERHLATRPQPIEVRLAPNPDYLTTNNVVSVFCARDKLEAGGFLLCDGDVVMELEPLRALAKSRCCTLLIDQEVTLGAEEMKVVVHNGRVMRLSKELDPALCIGESIGIQHVNADTTGSLWTSIQRMVARGRTGAYYEEAFQHLIDAGVNFAWIPIPEKSWIEIDDVADYKRACARFSAGTPDKAIEQS
jgi:choline kinase